jgi:perosamine synthetase
VVNEFDINSYTIQISDTISQAFKKININRGKNIFVVNKEVFCGAVSDGDLRRAILNGATLHDRVEVATNFNAARANLEDSYADVNSAFMDEFDYLPILDRSKKIIRIIKKGEKIKIPLSEPNLSNRETELILDTLFTNMISSRGAYVEKFEKIFAEYLGINRNRVVAVSNGTLALYLALVTLGIKEGDEVIVPDLTFGATANAVIQAGAVPILVDINVESFNIDIKLIEKAITPKTKAIIPVHLYGNPVDLASLDKLAKKFGLIVIEDAAEALGSYFQNLHVGVTTEASTFSFFGNKTITTGEGGMVVFKDQESA